MTIPATPDEGSTRPDVTDEKSYTTANHTPSQQTNPDDASRPLALVQEMSQTRQILLGFVMQMTYFLASATNGSTLLIIPRMAEDLQASELAIQWVASSYTLANACGLLVSGRLADIYPRRNLFLIGLSINAIGCLVSGFLRNRIALCLVRAISGLGMALSMPSAFGVIGVSFRTEPTRTIAFAVMGLGYPVGAAIGQVLGGVMAGIGRHGWAYQFFVLAGLGAMSVVMGWIVIPRPVTKMVTSAQGDNDGTRIDWSGAGIITSALCLFTFSITQSGLVAGGWKNAYVPCLFVLSIILVGVFGVWERRVKRQGRVSPVVDLGIFSRCGWKVTAVLVSSFSAYTAISGWVYMTSIWYQDYKRELPLQAVLHVTPAPIVGIFACILVPVLAPRIKAPILLTFGGFSTAAACWLFAVEPAGTPYWACEFVANVMNPFGADFTMGIGSVLISNMGRQEEQYPIGALFQTSIQLSGTVGVCLCSLVQTLVFRDSEDLRGSLVVCWWMLAGFAWFSCVVVLIALRKVGLAKDVGEM